MAPVTLVLLWHMHQPEYRDYASGEFRQPWVYLHAMKDYSDMAWHLESHAGVRAVVNLTPVLLEQLEDYADQFASATTFPVSAESATAVRSSCPPPSP